MTSRVVCQQCGTLQGNLTQEARETEAECPVCHFPVGESATTTDTVPAGSFARSLGNGKRLAYDVVSRLVERLSGPDDEEAPLWDRSIALCRRHRAWCAAFGAAMLLVWVIFARSSRVSDREGAQPRRDEVAAIPASHQQETQSGAARFAEGNVHPTVSDGRIGAASVRAMAGKASTESSAAPTSTELGPSALASAPSVATGSADGSASNGSHLAPPRSTHWPVTPLVGALRNPQLIPFADLQAVYAESDSVREKFLAGGLTETADIARKGKAFKTLCALANALTMLEPMKLDHHVVSQQTLAKELLRSIAADEDHRPLLSQIATRWWEFDERPVPGIFFLGNVLSVDAVGAWTQYVVEISWAEGKTTIPVLCDAMRSSMGQNVTVFGVVVENPRESLEGYELSTPQLVLAGHLMPLGQNPRIVNGRRTLSTSLLRAK